MNYFNRLLGTIVGPISIGLIAACVEAAEPQRITNDGAFKFAPVFVKNGTEIIYSVHDEPTRVSLMRLSLPDKRLERVDASNPAHQFDADVSSDGRYLCFSLTYTSPQSILVIRDLKEGKEFRFIPRDARASVRAPKISPDQQRVVFTLSDDGGQQIAAVDMQAANLRRLTESRGLNVTPAISPDSRQIAFCSSRDGSLHLYVMNGDGSAIRQLTDHRLRDMRPAWAPDGKQLAFTSARDDNLEVYVIGSDGANLRRITDHPERDDFPVWHPNGQQLLVVSERDGDSDLYLIDVQK
jgi:TolB protein